MTNKDKWIEKVNRDYIDLAELSSKVNCRLLMGHHNIYSAVGCVAQ